MNPLYLSVAAVACYANDNDAFIPEIWAQMGLMILEENMVAANLVTRDFENEIKRFGDVVHTRRPGDFKIRRKVDGSNLAQQDAVSTDVLVPLDQWFYDSFTIKDGEGTKSMQELVTVYLLPAMQAVARGVDRALLGRIHAYFGVDQNHRSGRLNKMDSTNAKDFVLNARQTLNVNKADLGGRSLILSPYTETALLGTELFIKANERGDGGQALEDARLGRILGFDTFMDQNVNSVLAGADNDTSYLTSAAVAAGVATVAVDTGSNVVAVGEFVNIDGNDQPTYLIAGTDVSGACTSMVLNEPLKYAVADDAQVTRYAACTVNGSGFGVKYSLAINVDGYTTGKAPQIGQLIAFISSGVRHTYTVIESEDNGSNCDLYLDRPLDFAIANNDAAYPGPTGSFNWAMHKNALALVSRPLALPPQSHGVAASVAVHNNVSMRVTMQYDINAGGTVVNLDLLAGVAVLDARLAVALLG